MTARRAQKRPEDRERSDHRPYRRAFPASRRSKPQPREHQQPACDEEHSPDDLVARRSVVPVPRPDRACDANDEVRDPVNMPSPRSALSSLPNTRSSRSSVWCCIPVS